ncbi:MAG: hypothetical protein COW00_09455 [Bdellovibrio sp. CG12_big_fil_rev_8_21_14_0_65_39_13]|nr:MAG: hypothetical protein COW78_15045 [Bdellovibrio sp. CG22_combo_CG10-13_8_21_14_all_39_27]PIQ59645.1 MAG: hypothetical protein COW00_09455 [Bdellovibrio sp. CG12_big_fil_rev_8_21_14_0_65_39_13]PIR33395.1 MAG: hypothetical protein COV37_16575 [Bdellovibrio sp. CG11_big_fil_rev_8_21_14_0_20_39_38]
MNTLAKMQERHPFVLSETDLKLVVSSMLRKELEIFRIQDGFISIFDRLQFYSQTTDETSGFDHAWMLVLGERGSEDDMSFLGLSDLYLEIGFASSRSKKSIAFINKYTALLVDLLFSFRIDLCDSIRLTKVKRFYFEHRDELDCMYLNGIMKGEQFNGDESQNYSGNV